MLDSETGLSDFPSWNSHFKRDSSSKETHYQVTQSSVTKMATQILTRDAASHILSLSKVVTTRLNAFDLL